MLSIDGGEDDLYINRIARRSITGVVISPESITETDSVDNFSTWRALKSKYLYTKQFYEGFPSRVFGCETFSKYVFYTVFIAATALGIVWHNYLLLLFTFLLFVIRYLVQLAVINKNSHLFRAGRYHINLIFFLIFFNLSIICNSENMPTGETDYDDKPIIKKGSSAILSVENSF